MKRTTNFKHAKAKLSDFQVQVCIGTLLGDSSLSRPKNGRNHHLACYHSEKQLEWLNRKWKWLQPYSRPIQLCEYTDKRNGKSYRGGRFHTISAPCFTELAMIFYDNGKTITENLMQKMTHPVALACLVCDDGHWDRAGIGIASKQFTVDENQILAQGLRKTYSIDVTVYDSGKYPYTRIPAASVERVRSICLEFVPRFLWYKFGGDSYQTSLVGKIEKTCPICNKLFMSYASIKRIYCGQQCASIGRPKGYDTRKKLGDCIICGMEFVKYSKRHQRCSNCRTKPFPNEICRICGKSVNKHGHIYCSRRCSVIGGHIARGHNTKIPVL